jgi:hypothetical protein
MNKRCRDPRPHGFNALTTLLTLASAAIHGRLHMSCNRRRLPDDAVADGVSKAWETWAADPRYFRSEHHVVRFVRRTAFWKAAGEARRACRQVPGGDLLDRLPEGARRRGGSRWTAEDRAEVARQVPRLPAPEQTAIERYYFVPHPTDAAVAAAVYGVRRPPPRLNLRAWRLRRRALGHLGRMLALKQVGG